MSLHVQNYKREGEEDKPKGCKNTKTETPLAYTHEIETPRPHTHEPDTLGGRKSCMVSLNMERLTS